jgi:hypothetical protein
VAQLKIGNRRRCHQVRVGKPGASILLRVPGERAGLADRFMQRFHAEVRRARTALPVAAVNGYADAPIIGVFKVFHGTESGRRAEADIVACCRFRLVRPEFFCFGKHDAYDIFDVTALHCLSFGGCHPVAIPLKKNFNVFTMFTFPIRAAGAQ